MNTYQSQIIQELRKANSSIKVAVSWLTDPVLIEELIKKAMEPVKVEVIMSGDEWNVLRFHLFKRLEDFGGKVQKFGPTSVNENGFMHSKFCIIDNRKTLDGSYNWTINAQSNIEQWRNDENHDWTSELISKFEKLMQKSVNFFYNISNPDEIISKYEPLEKKHIQPIGPKRYEYEEKLNLVPAINKNKVRTTSSFNLIPEEKITTSEPSVKNREHRFHGGRYFQRYLKSSCYRRNIHGMACYQKYHILNTFNSLNCSIVNGILTCSGNFQPKNCDIYKVRIEYHKGFSPKVFIDSPKIEQKNEIHMYKDGSLCLYYPQDLKWKNHFKISEYTIPWVVEWIIFYELWQITGKWLGNESPHPINY